MSELTPTRLAELRRIAAETTPGTYEWRIIETALALLDRIEALEAENERLRREREEIVDSETHFALYNPDLNWWECQAKDCGLLWEFMEDGNPYEHGMRFCPRCGRRIVMGLNKSTVITLKQREHHSAR